MADNVSSSIKEHELPALSWKKWDEIKKDWFNSKYWKCLDRFNLKMSCADCEYIYITTILSIDKKGRLNGYTKIKENVCGGKPSQELEDCLMGYIKEITYPKELRGLKIEAKFGTGLGC